jgi:hypothetical protein
MARVRRATAVAAAACVGSTVVFTAFAAGSTHLRKVTASRRPVHRTTRRPAGQPVTAPAPPLVAVSSPAPAPSPSPSPAPAPAPQQAPVVVSGGS